MKDAKSKTSIVDTVESISLAAFLEGTAPGCELAVSSLAARLNYRVSAGPAYNLNRPEIKIHCGNETCNGARFFRCLDNKDIVITYLIPTPVHVTYTCSNCLESKKIYSLLAHVTDEAQGSGQCYKLGELPLYGPTTSSRLISLIGPERDLFLKGRRSEIQGLGIGAFAYYRRVLESQKNRILDEIIKVAERLRTPEEKVLLLKDAKKEGQFTTALTSIKDAIPQTLFINGHNPMTLLYRFLSDGLHEQSDEHCLAMAQAVRVIMTDLADRLAQALKDEAELNQALSRLMGN